VPDAGERQHYALAALFLQNIPSTHWTEGQVGPRAGLDNMRKRKISCVWQELNYIPLKSARDI